MSGYKVHAIVQITQARVSDKPHVPAGTSGQVVGADDFDPPMMLVDFGQPYGQVLCDLDEVE